MVIAKRYEVMGLGRYCSKGISLSYKVSYGNLMHTTMTIINNTVSCTWNLLGEYIISI